MIQKQMPKNQDVTEVLLTCLNYGNRVSLRERLAGVSVEEYRQVVELAQRHNVAPLVYHRLQQLNVKLSDDLVEILKLEKRKGVIHMMRIFQELHPLLQLFHEKNLAVIVLKGAYLAESVYEQIGLRTMRDVDLLVKKQDLPQVESALLAFGYLPAEPNRVIITNNHHFRYFHPESKFMVEIHWTIIDENLSLQIDVEGLWQRAQTVTLAQAPTMCLSPEDLLLHLCMHTVIHAYDMQKGYEMRLRMLCDIGEVLQHFESKIDWREMKSRARQWGVGRAIYVVLRLTCELLDSTIRVGNLELLMPDHFDEDHFYLAKERIIASTMKDETALQESNHLVLLTGSKSWLEKLTLLRGRVLPTREEMSNLYPPSAASWRIYLYYPVRWLELFTHYGFSVWHLLRGDSHSRAFADYANQNIELREWLFSD